jgi:uncharacterized lipoprotein YmbA
MQLMHPMKRIVISFGLAFLSVSGCMNLSPTPDASRFFTLIPLPQSEPFQARSTDKTNALLVGIAPIRFPGYLDREQIVTRAAQNRLVILENDRWAEPLEENFGRVLAQNLGMLLGTRVIRYPWQQSLRPTCQIEMEVLRFEPSADQQVELLAHWAVIDHSNKTRLVFKETRVARRTTTKSMEASVAALSESLGDLSREIADTILARFRPDDR